MTPLPVTTQTAYAEMLEQLMALDARRSIGQLPGAFVTKQIKGRTYHYFQYSAPGGTTRQAYVGPKSRALDAIVRKFPGERDVVHAEEATIASLAAVLRAGGAGVTDAASARLLRALADAGIFKLGGVLVGTHAFIALGNVLGVKWGASVVRTEDVDVAVDRVVEVAMPDVRADVPATLESLKMGFFPVPGFSPTQASTSFKVRGKGLRVDFITPARGGATRPVRIARFNAAAAPLRYVDFILEDTVPAAVVNGGGILVVVPDPARFAIHKLLVAADRPRALHVKAEKDLAQAALVIDALAELRPQDLRRAWRDARRRGKSWARQLDDASAMLKRRAPAAAAQLKKVG